jgi:phosphatidylserine/phosphatidylglycerophosphate/cardiolipin synthase-like enzyme
MSPRRHRATLALTVVLLGSGITGLEAHQDPCHARHACPSDAGAYVCGDRGSCDECPDNLYCLGGTPRSAAQETPVPAPPSSSKVEEASCPTVTVCFTPGEDCTERIVRVLGEAQTSILVQAYAFTSAPIAKALVDAKKRGVRVEAILDKSNRTDKYSAADFLANSGIPTRIDAQHAIAHNKVIVIDGETVIGGSFNYTRAAQEKNAENVEIT